MYKLILTLCFIFSAYCFQADYYWRDYFGEVPEDAVIGGININGQNVYIGQAYVKCEGIVVAPINPGVKEVFVTQAGVKNVLNGIKILCGRQGSFYWIRTNFSAYNEDVLEHISVLGGHEDEYRFEFMTIGRVIIDGQVHIGKVNAFWADPYFFYNNGGKETVLSSYEVLMYTDGSPKIA